MSEAEEAADDYTRRDSLEEIIKHLQTHGHLCIDGRDFEPAQMIVAAAQMLTDALGKLEDIGVADEPYTESAHTRAGGTSNADPDQTAS